MLPSFCSIISGEHPELKPPICDPPLPQDALLPGGLAIIQDSCSPELTVRKTQAPGEWGWGEWKEREGRQVKVARGKGEGRTGLERRRRGRGSG